MSVKVFIKYGPTHDVDSVRLGVFWEQDFMEVGPNNCDWEENTPVMTVWPVGYCGVGSFKFRTKNNL